MAKAEHKTNVMRALEQKKIAYTAYQYPHEGGAVDGVTVAGLIGKEVSAVYKTLVTAGAKGQHYVFVIPVNEELDLKKAAKAVGEKSISMIPVAQILGLTGYVRGGCSPIGMKKQFRTVLHEAAQMQLTITVSAGKIGEQVELAPADLCGLIRADYADLIRE